MCFQVTFYLSSCWSDFVVLSAPVAMYRVQANMTGSVVLSKTYLPSNRAPTHQRWTVYQWAQFSLYISAHRPHAMVLCSRLWKFKRKMWRVLECMSLLKQIMTCHLLLKEEWSMQFSCHSSLWLCLGLEPTWTSNKSEAVAECGKNYTKCCIMVSQLNHHYQI